MPISAGGNHLTQVMQHMRFSWLSKSEYKSILHCMTKQEFDVNWRSANYFKYKQQLAPAAWQKYPLISRTQSCILETNNATKLRRIIWIHSKIKVWKQHECGGNSNTKAWPQVKLAAATHTKVTCNRGKPWQLRAFSFFALVGGVWFALFALSRTFGKLFLTHLYFFPPEQQSSFALHNILLIAHGRHLRVLGFLPWPPNLLVQHLLFGDLCVKESHE